MLLVTSSNNDQGVHFVGKASVFIERRRDGGSRPCPEKNGDLWDRFWDALANWTAWTLFMVWVPRGRRERCAIFAFVADLLLPCFVTPWGGVGGVMTSIFCRLKI